MARLRSRQAETEDVNPRRLGRGAVKRQHIDRWAVGATQLAPGVVGDVHLHPTTTQAIEQAAAGSNAGQLLVLTATGVSIASGGDYVTFDSIVEQLGFESTTAAGESWSMPIAAVGTVTVEIEWASYQGGGTVELEVAGAVPASGVIGSGSSGARGRGTIPFQANIGQTCRLKVTQTSGAPQTADVMVRVAVPDPIVGGPDQWTKLFDGDVWDLTHDGTNWWTTEGLGETVSRGLRLTSRDRVHRFSDHI